MLVVFDDIIPIVTVRDIPVTVLGIPAHLMRRLQSVLNAAVRLIFNLKRSDHITDALVILHWLRVLKRIQYMIAVLSYKVLHGTAPRYLRPLTRVADIPGRRVFRSASTDRLEVPYFKLSTIGGRAFPVAASQTGLQTGVSSVNTGRLVCKPVCQPIVVTFTQGDWFAYRSLCVNAA